MRLSWRCKASALVAAVLVHAGIAVMLMWQAQDTGVGAAGPGVVRVSLGHAGGTPDSSAAELAQVPEAAMVAVTEPVTEPAIEEAVPTWAPVTQMPVEPVEQAVDEVAPEPEPVVVDEAVATAPTEASSVTWSATTLLPAETEVVDTVESVEAIEAPLGQTEYPDISGMTPAPILVPDTEEVTVAEAIMQAPPGEVVPIVSIPELVPVSTIRAEAAAGLEFAADTTPPDAVMESVEDVQPVNFLPVEELATSTAAEPRERVATASAIELSPPGKGDSHQQATLLAGQGARVETAGNPLAHQSYLEKVLRHIARFKRYPRAARRDGVVGKVHLRFTILADGRLQSPELTGSSGDSRLDREALQMLSRASPFPPIPRSLGMDTVELNLPVQFTLNRKRTLF